jgi:hypothetical protein
MIFIFLSAGLAKIEEAGMIEDENQECKNSENNLNKRGQQRLYLFDV